MSPILFFVPIIKKKKKDGNMKVLVEKKIMKLNMYCQMGIVEGGELIKVYNGVQFA